MIFMIYAIAEYLVMRIKILLFLIIFISHRPMKINFDKILTDSEVPKLSHTTKNAIDISVQSPIFETVTKAVSPQNYKSQLYEMKSLVVFPEAISSFLQQQIESQLATEQEPKLSHQNSTFIMDKVQKYENQILQIKKIPKVTKPKKKSTSWVYNYKKNSTGNPHVSREAEIKAKQSMNLTFKPHLYQNKYKKKVEETRKFGPYRQVASKKYSIYQHLYHESTRRKAKQQMRKNDRKKVQEEQKVVKKPPKVNKNYISLFQRLDHILEQRHKKKNCDPSIDLTTGRELFKPDLTSSKVSYKLFAQSLSKEKTMKTIQNPESESGFKSNKKMQKNKEDGILDEKVINYFTEVFYPQNQNSSVILAIQNLTKQDFKVLQPFIHEIQQLENQVYEQQTTISSQKNSQGKLKEVKFIQKENFRSKFELFYYSLNLYDREVLRKKIRSGRKKQLDRLFENTSRQNLHTHQPEINIRSNSLDNLAKGHQKHIYYV